MVGGGGKRAGGRNLRRISGMELEAAIAAAKAEEGAQSKERRGLLTKTARLNRSDIGLIPPRKKNEWRHGLSSERRQCGRHKAAVQFRTVLQRVERTPNCVSIRVGGLVEVCCSVPRGRCSR